MLSQRISAGLFIGIVCFLLPRAASTQTNVPADSAQERLKSLEESLNFVEQKLAKQINDVLWFQRLADVAIIDKVRFTGPPPRVTNNPTGQGAGNEIIVAAYTFLPKNHPSTAKLPLLVLVHGGVHSDIKPEGDAHVVRELIDQGYAIIAPDYRGSTGYGRDYWRMIDYGGAGKR